MKCHPVSFFGERARGRRAADTAGVAAALIVAWRGGSMFAVVLVAVAVTAGLRLVL